MKFIHLKKAFVVTTFLSIATFAWAQTTPATTESTHAPVINNQHNATTNGNKLNPTNTSQNGLYLFVIRASQASITKSNDTFEITLKDIYPKVLYFSDRPTRKAGALNSSNFIDGWLKNADSFETNPPNSSILYVSEVDEKGLLRAIAVELKNPVKISDNSWKFNLRDLEGKISTGDFDDVSVFVDSGGLMQLVAY